MRKSFKWCFVFTVIMAVFLVISFSGCAAETPVAEEPAPAADPEPAAEEPAPDADPEPAAEEPAPDADPEPAAQDIPEGLVIGYNVSLLSNSYHQADSAWAIEHAREKYGATVQVFDGKLDHSTIVANLDQQLAQGVDMISMHALDGDTVTEGLRQAREMGIPVAAFYCEVDPDVLPIPHVYINESEAAYEMGRVAAEKWTEYYPDIPIVFGNIGFPDNPVTLRERTNPFAEGIRSVAPDAEDRMFLSGGAHREDAYNAMQDMIQANPDINIIYAQCIDYSMGAIAALEDAGRGQAEDGVPLTEILVGTDAGEAELRHVFDPSSSLKVTMGLPPMESGITRVDVLMKAYTGEINPDEYAAFENFNIQMDFWNTTVEEAEQYLFEQMRVVANLLD